MKSYKNPYPQIHNFGNLYVAFLAARKAKHDRVAVASFEFDLERNLLQLETELREQTYHPGAYTNFYVHEPKRRLVSAAPFRAPFVLADSARGVVHHALCQVVCNGELVEPRAHLGETLYPHQPAKRPRSVAERTGCLLRAQGAS
jgi:RNA-directed DNA polymerase